MDSRACQGARQASVDVRVELLSAASSGEKSAWTRVHDTYTRREQYYETMSGNVRAEFLDCLEEGRRHPLMCLSGTGTDGECRCSHNDCTCTFRVSVVSDDAVTAGKPVNLWVAEQQAALGALKDNVALADGELFWITTSDVEATPSQTSTSTSHVRLNAHLEGFTVAGRCTLQHRGYARLRVLLFAGDFASRLRAAVELLLAGAAQCPELEAAVLNPQRDVAGTYGSCTRKALGARLHTDVMPINEDQLLSIHGLRNRLEVIHGPPGTGKSTTIFHTLSAHLPKASAAIVTCVCNQAVDAVAEKLHGVQDLHSKGCLPMLVLGNPARVGPTAADHVLKAQAEREELVVFMRQVCSILQRWVEGLERLQAARADKLLAGKREIKQSRLSQGQIASIPGLRERVLRNLLEKHDQDRTLALRRLETLAELESRWMRLPERVRNETDLHMEMRQAHLDVVNRVRRAMAAAAAYSLPVEPGGRSVHGGSDRRVLWHTGPHLSKERERLETARSWLHFAVQRAPHRVVRRTRVFLCTIPSSYKVEQLQEEYPEDFPKHVFMAMCDEAAATAETYVPLLMKLAVGNLVLLGDHKQLQPLVLAENHTEPEEKRVSRSLMERVLDAGRSAGLLRTQYRMFSSLCSIVSGLFYHGELVTAEEKLRQDAQEEAASIGGNRKGGMGRGLGRGAFVEICWSDGVWYPGVVKRPHPQGGFYVDCHGETLYIPKEWVRRPAEQTAVIFQDSKQRLRWFDSAEASKASEVAVGTSYANAAEVAQIRELLHSDPLLGRTQERIKVVTLYKTQLQLMQRTCADIVEKRRNVEFVTVDACQGTEAPHIILSTVRTNRGRIGFASNPRRLNVAISRAIKSLTIVGSMRALSGDRNWATVATGCQRLGETHKVSTVELSSSEAARLTCVQQELDALATSKARKQQAGGVDSMGGLPHAKGFGGFGGKGGKRLGGFGFGGKGFGGTGGRGFGGFGGFGGKGSCGCSGKAPGGKNLGVKGKGRGRVGQGKGKDHVTMFKGSCDFGKANAGFKGGGKGKGKGTGKGTGTGKGKGEGQRSAVGAGDARPLVKGQQGRLGKGGKPAASGCGQGKGLKGPGRSAAHSKGRGKGMRS